MTNIYIDGEKYTVQDNLTVIEAARSVGINIPHFCWHPELSISGNCRMCLIETGFQAKKPDNSLVFNENGKPIFNYGPKLQIACATRITEGMCIRTQSPAVADAQEAVMEFILINHPLDCPICDEAGQCKLQDYTYKWSNGESRFIEEKNHKPKRTSWGPNVIYDAERCISCSRCIRFAREYAKQPVLAFVNRGDRVTIKVEDGKEFDNDYSMNVIDICPVGALTSKDFRFKSRVWDMSFNDSICNGCSRGCNIEIGVRNNSVLRLEPRNNMKVNHYWMCDEGRLNYAFMNENRISAPMSRQSGDFIHTNWEEAIDSAAKILKTCKPNEIFFVLSPFHTNEAIYLSDKLIKDIFKGSHSGYFEHRDDTFADDKLKTNDRSPNQTGLKKIIDKSEVINIDNLIEKISHGNIKVLYIFDTNLHNIAGIDKLMKMPVEIISHCTNQSAVSEKSKVVFAAGVHSETEGTMTNFDGIVQLFRPALVNSENQRFMGMKMSRLDKFGAANDRWMKHELRDVRSDWRIIQMLGNKFSAGWSYTAAEQIFNIVSSLTPFKNMTYAKLTKANGLKIGDDNSKIEEHIPYKTNFMKSKNC